MKNGYVFPNGSVPVAVAARVYRNDFIVTWILFLRLPTLRIRLSGIIFSRLLLEVSHTTNLMLIAKFHAVGTNSIDYIVSSSGS